MIFPPSHLFLDDAEHGNDITKTATPWSGGEEEKLLIKVISLLCIYIPVRY